MPVELSAEREAVLRETRRIEDAGEFRGLLEAVTPEMARVIREVFAPNQPLDVTLTELRDVVLTVNAYRTPLASVGYDAARRGLLCNAIRLLDTAQLWLGEKTRSGDFRPRVVKEVVEASRPWRERLAAIGGHAFIFEPDVARQFADVNSTGTIEEERKDLADLNGLVAQHRERLEPYGLTPELVGQGLALLEEAEGRDLLGILGLRSYDEALALRDRILTFAILLGREARAAGVNACFFDPEAKGRFEATSFRNALRRLRAPRRSGRSAADDELPAAEPPAEPAAPGETPSEPVPT